MAFETGTATDHEDLYAKLILFLTTDTDLVADGEEWVNVWDEGDHIVLRGPGLADADQVYVGMTLFADDDLDAYSINFKGMTGIIPSAVNIDEHINPTPAHCRMFLDSGSMTYWFVANGRRFSCVVKISTVYEAMYAGLFLPYSDPLSYPYPMFIGGSGGEFRASAYGPESWRSEDENHSHFISPEFDNSTSGRRTYPGAWVIDPAGQWREFGQTWTDALKIGPEKSQGTYFTDSDSEDHYYYASAVMTRLMEGYGGQRALVPCTLLQIYPADQTYGVLQGVYRCQGVANLVENTITVDGLEHLVVQNVFRTSFQDYWALALE